MKKARQRIGPIILTPQQVDHAKYVAIRRHLETPGKRQAAGCRDDTPKSSFIGALAEIAFLVGFGRYTSFDGTGRVVALTVNDFNGPDFGLNIQVRGGIGNIVRPRDLPKYSEHLFVYVSTSYVAMGRPVSHLYIEGWKWCEEILEYGLASPDPTRDPCWIAPTKDLRDPRSLPFEAWGDRFSALKFEDPSVATEYLEQMQVDPRYKEFERIFTSVHNR